MEAHTLLHGVWSVCSTVLQVKKEATIIYSLLGSQTLSLQPVTAMSQVLHRVVVSNGVRWQLSLKFFTLQKITVIHGLCMLELPMIHKLSTSFIVGQLHYIVGQLISLI